MSNFWQRLISGTVYTAVVVLSIIFTPSIFGAIFLVVTLLAVREFHCLMKSSHLQTRFSLACALLLYSLIACLANWDGMPLDSLVSGIGILGIILMCALVSELFTKAENPMQNWGTLLQAQIMIVLPFALMNTVAEQGKMLLLALFITIWLNDSGAYCIGSLLAKRPQGNHKMFPRVSPNKSWEGLIGGMVVALIAGIVYWQAGWMDGIQDTMPVWLFSLVFCLIISVAGTLGDLMESLLKRTIGVKDSGRFMPGHGGVLDRFDSLLLATPAIYIFILLC